mmetsp:Transcript_19249/g.28745  ORF Transcript_19249/g.28745 Transcript_19249/m.28745 type:complete len:617 (+) Transcript_19249:103-1953(+)
MGAEASKILKALDKGQSGVVDSKRASVIAGNLPKKLRITAEKFLETVTEDKIPTENIVKFFEGKAGVSVREVLNAIKKADKPKEKALEFTADEVKQSQEIAAMASRPKGKPTPEEAKKLKAQKAAKAKFFKAIRERLGLDPKSYNDKKIQKALESFIESSKKSSENEKKGGRVISLEPPSGTRDFYPDEYRIQRWLFETMRKVAKLFGFQEYDAPVLESAELYKRKAGEEITQQMYNFIDKEGAEVTLRPEMTPTLARMVLKRMDEKGEIRDLLPFKWFSIPQCWRFETTQRGRKREHYQWNMDIVGVKGVTAELELLASVTTFFKSLGVTAKDVGIKINSRKVLGAIVEAAGVPKELFAPVCVIIDKLDKIGGEAVTELLIEKKVPEASAKMILDAMKCKTIESLAKLCEGKVDMSAVDELKTLFANAKDYGFLDFLIFDASVVRGLAYYTGIVFECFDRRGELRAICGGGRYDRLLTLYGSQKEVPCVGFGFGDCVIIELLKELKLLPGIKKECRRKVDFVVAPYDDSLFGAACSVAAMLREAKFSVDLLQTAQKARSAFSYADRAGAVRMVYVAPSEWEKKSVRVKDLREGEKNKGEDIKLSELVERMRKAMQ